MFYLKTLVSIFYGECRFAVVLDLFCFISIHYEWVDGMVCGFIWRPIIDLGMCFVFVVPGLSSMSLKKDFAGKVSVDSSFRLHVPFFLSNPSCTEGECVRVLFA